MARVSYHLLLIINCILLCINQCASRKGKLHKLNEDNWNQLLTGEWMVEFFAPWCPACQSLQPNWESFSTWSDELNIRVAHIDVTTNPGLSGRFMVTALPTIYHVKDGEFRQYKGSRETAAFVDFIEEKRWQKIDAVSKWTHPNSFQMSIVSYFFKISMGLRAVHNRLVQDYGIPYWGSYILFALATILLGAILGLIIVCVIDILFPYKHSSFDQDSLTSGERDSAEDLIQDAHSDPSKDSKEIRKRKRPCEDVGDGDTEMPISKNTDSKKDS
ncbi:thioredoxin-related transmembrane protein 1-like [Brevipalpus obovatus]|uniref:thioredoxin-related transmembrane protein 1-like n=1 Tax=Brevipalpus obovatus TaxID=246614 RepID=UPI003D9EC79E